MSTSAETPRVTNVVALVSSGQVWTSATDGLSRLPDVVTEVPWATPAQLSPLIADRSAVRISPILQLSTDPARVLHVFQTDEGSTAGRWGAPMDLDEPDDVITAVEQALAETAGRVARPPRRPDWYRADWQAEVDAWIDERLAELQRVRTGPSEEVRMWSLSAVFKVPYRSLEHDGRGEVFFKATGEWFRAEPKITQTLTQLAPDRVPQVLSVDADRPWMLMEPFPETEPDPTPELTFRAAEVLAEVQIAALNHQEELQAAGCPDRTLSATLAGLSVIIHESLELEQLTPEERTRAEEAEPVLAQQVIDLYDCGVPSTLGHGDLHIGNVAADGDHLVLFDWTDGCLTHPFIDAVHLSRSAGDKADEVLHAYAEIWRRQCPDADIDRAVALAPHVNKIFQAISFEGIYRAQEDAAHWEMSGVVARYLREFGG